MQLSEKNSATEIRDDGSLVDYLLSAQAVRERSRRVFEYCKEGKGEFHVHMDRLSEPVQLVADLIRERFPKLDIPFHARFRHFQVGHIDRLSKLRSLLASESKEEIARTEIDLVVTSVLLDAGAGADWEYVEDGHVYARSEGLAVASFNMFIDGAFSSDRNLPLRADGRGLLHLTEEVLKKGFQVSVSNPLIGTKGRVELLQKLGKVVEAQSDYFGPKGFARPGHLVDYFLAKYPDRKLPATDILNVLLRALGKIWPGRVVLNDVNLGDCFRHPGLGEGPESFVPFHKLSQWLTYSLIEPLISVGFEITNIDGLTGLAEYRNGGLFVDTGVIEPKFNAKEKALYMDSRAIIEWRALTLVLLDELAVLVRKELKVTEKELPLGKILEGGTWWAGRRLAQKLRAGKPPFEMVSDVTVF